MNQRISDELDLVAQGKDEEIQLWMQLGATQNMFSEYMISANVDARNVKKLLAILYMKFEPEVFSMNDHDIVMKNEVNRFYDIFIDHLKTNGVSDITMEFDRIFRFYNAWFREDLDIVTSSQD